KYQVSKFCGLSRRREVAAMCKTRANVQRSRSFVRQRGRKPTSYAILLLCHLFNGLSGPRRCRQIWHGACGPTFPTNRDQGSGMAYLMPSEFVTKMVDAGESKIFMSARDTVIRAYMAGAILALAAWFAVTINVNTGQPIVGALLFPVGFSMLYLLAFDLLTGVFVLSPLAWLDKRPGVTLGGVLRNWLLVFIGNYLGALTVALLMAIVFTFGWSTEPDKVGKLIAGIGESRTLGYEKYGAA